MKQAVPIIPGCREAADRGTRGREVAQDLDLRAEVAVIGSGAGGAACAAGLARAGRDVVLLEAGGHHTAADFTQREDEMLRLLFADAGCRATADGAIPILQGRAVGGSTAHNTGYCYRAPPGIVERWRREAGFAPSDAELARLYGEVERVIDAREVPAGEVNLHNDIVRRGAQALGFRSVVTRQNRSPTCSGCGYCVLGCAYNRKQSALTAWVPMALAAGARLISDAPVRRVRAASAGVVVEGTFVDQAGLQTRHRFRVEAREAVVACGAIETPLLLMRSGLAGGGHVGRNLRLHPAAPVGAFFDEDIESWRGVPQSVMVEEFASFLDTGRGGYLLMPANATPALMAAIMPGVGAEHRAHMRRLRGFASGAVLLHDETRGRVRARAFSGRPDIRYWPDAADGRVLLHGVERLAQIFFAAGAREVILPFRGEPPVRSPGAIRAAVKRAKMLPHLFALSSVHPQGTCAIGRDARSGAVRADLRLFGAERVTVADASVFPSSIGVPPQETIMLVGLAAADAVSERLSRR